MANSKNEDDESGPHTASDDAHTPLFIEKRAILHVKST